MKKLLHERLREIAPRISKSCDDDWGIDELREAMNVACYSTYQSDLENTVLAIADEIEKYYDPKPRDPEGNPVHKDMEVEGGVVKHWSVSEDGSWTIFDNDYEEIQCRDKDEPIRVPKPKVLDADGVPCKKGETVWLTDEGTKNHRNVAQPMEIECFYPEGAVGFHDSEGTFHSTVPDVLTHREPDSLEKLRDDIAEFSADGAYHGAIDAFLQRFEDRLTAIMERDA